MKRKKFYIVCREYLDGKFYLGVDDEFDNYHAGAFDSQNWILKLFPTKESAKYYLPPYVKLDDCDIYLEEVYIEYSKNL